MNYVVIEGTVTSDIWNYGDDTLFRLRGHENGGMFFTVRFAKLPLAVKPGTRVTVSGKLVSREQRVSLKDFVARATRGNGDKEKPSGELIEQLAEFLEPVNRSYTEILASEIRNLA